MTIVAALKQSKTLALYALMGGITFALVIAMWGVASESSWASWARNPTAGDLTTPVKFVSGLCVYALIHMGVCIRYGLHANFPPPLSFMTVGKEDIQPASLICFFFAGITAAAALHFAL